MGQNKKKPNHTNRVSNVPQHSRQKETINKVNGGVFVYTGDITVGELAKQLNVNSSDIIKKLFMSGTMVTINTSLSDELIGQICLEFGYDFKKEKIVSEENFEELEIVDDEDSLIERPAVVTIMGHVDHGKTTLIDTIRKSNIVSTEAGAITQAIGAYQKEIKGKKITFIDTPGHEAFTAMRSRGASVTDIVIIVVAADDGVMPQTKEAIDHAKAAGVPIIVAVNKIDKPTANVDRVKQELMALEVCPEEWGGDTVFCNISAKQNIGVDTLLENVLVVAELAELKANPNRFAYGTVLEAFLDKGEGPKANILVQNGTLNASDYVVVGASYGRVRRMTNEYKQVLKTAGPSTPVSIIGLAEVPVAGDRFMAFPTEKQARDIAEKRKQVKVDSERHGSAAMSLDDLYNRIHEGEVQTINVIIKADLQGSAEAIKASLEKLNNDEVKINVIRSTAGAITESDVLLASASNAIIYGFNIRPDALVRAKAESEKVEIRLHRIIYALIEEMEAAMKGLLKPELVEKVTGQAEVRQLFKVGKVGTIAGCYIINGSIKHNQKIRLLRDGVIVYEGELASLKRFQADVKEVQTGFECGIMIKNFNDEHEGDIIEGYEMIEVKK